MASAAVHAAFSEKTMNHATTTIRTIDLGYEQLLVFDGGRDTRVRVLHGATWLTQEGEAGDEFLQRGSDVAVHGGRVLVQGLQPARVQIVRHVESGTARLATWLLRAWRAARRQVSKVQFGAVEAAPCN